MKKNLKSLLSSLIAASTLAQPQLIQASQQEFSDMPKEVRLLIVSHAVIDNSLRNTSSVNLALVCSEWQELIKSESEKGKLFWKAWYGVLEHEEVYQKFIQGIVIYRPIPGSDEGMIKLKISDLANPLEGSLDLSQCGELDRYLTISTGYRKKKLVENANKLEIWLVPWFLIKKKLNSTAKHFQKIMPGWNHTTAPIGIFFTWGGWERLDWYDHLTSKNLEFISSNDLYNTSLSTFYIEPGTTTHAVRSTTHYRSCSKISCSFYHESESSLAETLK